MAEKYLIDRFGTYLKRDTVLGWSVYDQHDSFVYALSKLPIARQNTFLRHLPEELAAEARMDLALADARSRGVTSATIMDFVITHGSRGTADFVAFCQEIKQAKNPLRHCLDLKIRKIRRPWLARMGV